MIKRSETRRKITQMTKMMSPASKLYSAPRAKVSSS